MSEQYGAYSTTDNSTASLLKATTSAAVADSVSYTQTVSFASNVGIATVNIVLTNNGGSTLYNFEYLRGFDPDQGYHNENYYTTNNDYCTDEDGTVWVIASTNNSPTGALSFSEYTAAATSPFFFIAPKSPDYTVISTVQKIGWESYSDFRDVTTTGVNGVNYAGNVLGFYQLGASTYADLGIGLRFKVGELAAGGSVTLTYYMLLDSNAANALTGINNISAVATPTFSPAGEHIPRRRA